MNNKALLSKALACATAVPVAFMALANSAFAAASISLDANAVTGATSGIGEAADSISGSVNNQYLWTIAIMFIGFSFVIGLVAYLVKGHRKV